MARDPIRFRRESSGPNEVFEEEGSPLSHYAPVLEDFSTHALCETDEEGFVLRDSYADLRVHALAPDPETVWVVPGALTRVAALGSRLVNVSSGGVTKDTWVLG